MNAGAEPVSPPATMQRSKPLLPVRGVMSLVDKNEVQVLSLIEDGKLAWEFDVSLLGPKRGRSKELRVRRAAVADYLRGQACSLEWPEVLRLLLPHDEPMLLSRDITRILNVSGTHSGTFIQDVTKLVTTMNNIGAFLKQFPNLNSQLDTIAQQVKELQAQQITRHGYDNG